MSTSDDIRIIKDASALLADMADGPPADDVRAELVAALERLAARIEQAERNAAMFARDALDELAALQQAERERDEALRDGRLKDRALTDYFADASRRADDAEARVAQLTEALEVYADRSVTLEAALREVDNQVLRACQLLPMTYSLATEKDAENNVERAAIILRRRVRPGIRAALVAMRDSADTKEEAT
jgi:hypothetical protein